MKYVGFCTSCCLHLVRATPLHADQEGRDVKNFHVLPCQGQWVSSKNNGDALRIIFGPYSQVSCSKHIQVITLLVAQEAQNIEFNGPLAMLHYDQ